jgi:hypothetical protein
MLGGCIVSPPDPDNNASSKENVAFVDFEGLWYIDFTGDDILGEGDARSGYGEVEFDDAGNITYAWTTGGVSYFLRYGRIVIDDPATGEFTAFIGIDTLEAPIGTGRLADDRMSFEASFPVNNGTIVGYR